MSELYHYGIKGMKWGIRRSDAELARNRGDFQYAKESRKKVHRNSDGSETFPKGFVFNRVGQRELDVNKSGGLYVSYGKDDAARYVKSLGPTPIRKLFGVEADTIQHISVKEPLHSASDKQVAIETAKLLQKNHELFRRFNDSFYSLVTTGDYDKKVTEADLDRALKNPSGKEGQKLAYGVSSFLGDEVHASESKIIYDHFRKRGYDAIPDIHDRLSGTSNTALIVINPNKVEIKSRTVITKEIMKEGRAYVKSIGKLKVSDLIK